MPNGGMTQEEFDVLEEFFKPLGGTIRSFAVRHNLQIEKYYHDFPSWDLCFAHPEGGCAKLVISREKDGSAGIMGTWWLDVYREFTRYIRNGKKVIISSNIKSLVDQLDPCFHDVMTWKRGDWTTVAGDYRYPWNQYTEKEFKEMQPNYPIPKI